MKKILILCTGNSCRSQILHGYLDRFTPDAIQVYSAGVEQHGVNLRAVETMKADGIDISDHTSNHIDEYSHLQFDYVITVCDNAKERCPVFPSDAIRVHQHFPDPAKASGSDEEVRNIFSQVRDEIRAFSEAFISAYL